MRIGYACLKIGVISTPFRTCRMNKASDEVLQALIQENLNTLDQIIDYNIKSNIMLYRISSDLIPFGGSPVNKLAWWDLFKPELVNIGAKIKACGIRVSLHPGQYTIINSDRQEVVDRAFADLEYHALILESMKLDTKNKIILHIGGVYGDKEEAIHRFKTNFLKLSTSVKERLVIENDDKSYNISDVLEIGKNLDIPVVFDNLHHASNPCALQESDRFWIHECSCTWKEADGPQKIHYAQQDPQKKAGSHSGSIGITQFLAFYKDLEGMNLDIMLEVKDKNLSAVKCINSTSKHQRIAALEVEWARYKYKVLENSQENYDTIRALLAEKRNFDPAAFYRFIEDSLQESGDIGSRTNAALHVWGYFKNHASKGEKDRFFKMLEDFQRGTSSISSVKNHLLKLSIKYRQDYLLDSYYFIL